MKLTIVASNRDRLKLNDNASQWFLKSIQWQDYNEPFELLIADGGSENYEELKSYFESSKERIPMRIVQHKIGIPFERALLNNVGVRNAKGDYTMTTDVDMLLGKSFVSTLMANVSPNALVESRTMYLKSNVTNLIYNGTLDLYNNIIACRICRIKKETTAGGCQCLSRENWNKVQFDESFTGWGSEDYDLLMRAKQAGLKVKWLGTSVDTIMLFHQEHPKPNIVKDLEYQENNKKILKQTMAGTKRCVNPNGWGGIK